MRIDRIFTRESWNPELPSPLSQLGLNIQERHYLVGVNGEALTAEDNLFNAFQGTFGVQTTLHINASSEFKGARTHVVEPIRSENALRKRGWVEDA